MKIPKAICLMLVVFMFGGCLTANKNKSDKSKDIEAYRLDLDNDTIEELVEVENRFSTHGDILIKITKPGKRRTDEPKIFTFTISGKFNRVEFTEIGCEGFREMFIYYDTAKNFTNVVIYKLKNDKLSQVFLASSNCDIETELDTVPRVKIGKNINGGKDCSVVARGNDWESWAWDGEKFVREQ